MHYLLLNALYDMAFPFLWERLNTHFTAGPILGRLNPSLLTVSAQAYVVGPSPGDARPHPAFQRSVNHERNRKVRYGTSRRE